MQITNAVRNLTSLAALAHANALDEGERLEGMNTLSNVLRDLIHPSIVASTAHSPPPPDLSCLPPAIRTLPSYFFPFSLS